MICVLKKKGEVKKHKLNLKIMKKRHEKKTVCQAAIKELLSCDKTIVLRSPPRLLIFLSSRI